VFAAFSSPKTFIALAPRECPEGFFEITDVGRDLIPVLFWFKVPNGTRPGAPLLGSAATTDAASLLKLEIFSFALVDAEVLVGVFRSRFGGECTGDGVGEALIGERSAMGGARFLPCCATGKYCEYTSSAMEIRNEYFSTDWQHVVEILT
jgi:hypothetical protein